MHDHLFGLSFFILITTGFFILIATEFFILIGLDLILSNGRNSIGSRGSGGGSIGSGDGEDRSRRIQITQHYVPGLNDGEEKTSSSIYTSS